MTYITNATVRRTIGVNVDQITDVDIDAFIVEIEKLVPRYFNTQFTMTEKIDILDGDGSDRIVLRDNPVWTVRELIHDGVTVTPAYLYLYREGGRINLSSGAEVSRFSNKRNIISVRYFYGKLDYSNTILTKTTASSIAGTNVVLSVSSASAFSTNDWIDIKSMDGHYEVAKITVGGTTTITVDQLVYTHLSGAIITKLEVSPIFTRIMNVICSIAIINRIIGGSAEIEAAYSLGELSVTLQDPNVLWKEALNQFIQERDELMKRIKIRPAIA